MTIALALLAIGLPALLVGAAVGVLVRARVRQGAGADATSHATSGGASGAAAAAAHAVNRAPGALAMLRASALDVAADPIVIVGADGVVLDCNAAALLLLDRHRTSVVGAPAASLRTLWQDDSAMEWSQLLATRAPWSGRALVRVPDGSHMPRSVHLVPVFGDDGAVRATVEAYRPTAHAHDPEDVFRAAIGDDEDGMDAAALASRELHRLSSGITALDRVVRQYERLVPAMRAEDPMTEVLAGLVVETRAVADAADVSQLLHELPRAVERLRQHLQRVSVDTALAADPQSGPPVRNVT